MVGYLFQKILIILENRGYVPEWVPWNVFENHGYENPKRCPDNHRGVYFPVSNYYSRRAGSNNL